MKTKDPKVLLENVKPEVRLLHTNTLALREHVNEIRKILIVRLETTLGANDKHPNTVSNARHPMLALTRDMGPDFAGAIAILEAAEASAAFKAAAAEVEPLLAASEEIEAEEDRQRQEKLRIEAELNETREAAKKTALAAAENHPAVVAVKQKLQAFLAKF